MVLLRKGAIPTLAQGRNIVHIHHVWTPFGLNSLKKKTHFSLTLLWRSFEICTTWNKVFFLKTRIKCWQLTFLQSNDAVTPVRVYVTFLCKNILYHVHVTCLWPDMSGSGGDGGGVKGERAAKPVTTVQGSVFDMWKCVTKGYCKGDIGTISSPVCEILKAISWSNPYLRQVDFFFLTRQ